MPRSCTWKKPQSSQIVKAGIIIIRDLQTEAPVTRNLPRTTFFAIVLLMLASTIGAATHRAVTPPSTGQALADVLGIGPMSGAAVSGTVASVSGTTITLNSGGAPAIRIETASAKFQSEQGAASINDVKTGMRITAFINTAPVLSPSSALSAQLIVIESASDLTVTGSVQSIDAAHSSFSVLGINIAADANTSFGTTFPTFAAIRGVGDLVVGEVVNVTAVFTGGSILAKRVQIAAMVVPAPAILRGTVKSISPSAWVITADGKDTTVNVDTQTKIVGDPKIGDSVQIMANVDSAHDYTATVIIKLGTIEPPATETLHGFVHGISPAQWIIGGPPGTLTPDFVVKITATTSIYPDPAVGDRVVVTGMHDATGAFVAMKIAKDV